MNAGPLLLGAALNLVMGFFLHKNPQAMWSVFSVGTTLLWIAAAVKDCPCPP